MSLNQARYTPESLLPAYSDLFRKMAKDLPAEVVANLKPQRVVKRHGTCSSVLMWKFWDKRQSEATLPHGFNGYGINYDPDRFETTKTDWILKLKFNTVRIYQKHVDVRSFLLSELPKCQPRGFNWREHPREIQIDWPFSFSGDPDQLPPLLLPKLLQLVRSTYPVYDDLMSRLEQGLSSFNKAEVISGRTPVRVKAANGARIEDKSIYRHGISRSLRRAVLQKYGNRCSICGIGFEPGDDIHIDHVVAFALGGLTTIENLKPAHELCNLKKGSGKVIPKENRTPAKIRVGWKKK